MKKVLKLTNLFIAALLLITFSCSNDDDAIVVPVIINLQDLEVTIDENPTTGEVVGEVQSNSNSSLTYSITSQTPSGALSINNTGELTVLDATAFDFEANPIITATVSATQASNTATVTINLNDLTNDNYPTNGIKLIYKLNNNATDSGSNNYNATDNNITYEADRNNNPNSVATFNGVDAFIEFPDAARFEPLMSSTLSFWIKTSQQSRFDLFDQRTGSNTTNAYNFGVIVNQVNADDISYSYPNYAPSNETAYTSNVSNSISISDGTWHHLVFIKDIDNSVMKLYIDGVEETSIPLTQDYDFAINGTLLLGKNYANTNYFEGSIDDLFIYDRALNANEVSTLFTYAD